MTTSIITSDKRYLSEIEEFQNSLPSGILNKTCTNVGGTHLAITNNEPYIIAVPTLNLIYNKLENHNNLCAIYGETVHKETVIKAYLEISSTPKIITTYNSLVKVLNILGDKAGDFNLLVDEYHMLFTECSYRMQAIKSLLVNADRCKKVTYMSASPIEEDFLPEELENLPYTTVKWLNETSYKLDSIECHHPLKSLKLIINQLLNDNYFLDGKQVGEIFIFLNSVNSIRSIIKTCKLNQENTKVVIADNELNQMKIQNIPLSKASGANKKINFFTSTAFAGIDLNSEAGLTIIVSDQNNKQTLLDVSTHIYQIVGRLRNNDNIFYKNVLHIYQPSRKNKKNAKTNKWESIDLDSLYEERKQHIESTANTTKDLVLKDNLLSLEARKVRALQFQNSIHSIDMYQYYNPETTEFEYLDLKRKYALYQAKIEYHLYKNGINLVDAYLNMGFEINNLTKADSKVREVEIELFETVNFKQLIQKYIDLRETNENNKETYLLIERNYPFIKEAYDLLGSTGIVSLRYSKSAIQSKVNSLSPTVTNYIKSELSNYFYLNTPYSAKEVKDVLQRIYNQVDINNLSSKATELFKYCKHLSIKTIKGYKYYTIESF